MTAETASLVMPAAGMILTAIVLIGAALLQFRKEDKVSDGAKTKPLHRIVCCFVLLFVSSYGGVIGSAAAGLVTCKMGPQDILVSADGWTDPAETCLWRSEISGWKPISYKEEVYSVSWAFTAPADKPKLKDTGFSFKLKRPGTPEMAYQEWKADQAD